MDGLPSQQAERQQKMNPEDQQLHECDFCYLQRLKQLFENAGMNVTLRNTRSGRHRKLKGFDILVDGKKIKTLKRMPVRCTCNV
jgi:hypothetical protein